MDSINSLWTRLDLPWLGWAVYKPICAQDMAFITQIYMNIYIYILVKQITKK